MAINIRAHYSVEPDGTVVIASENLSRTGYVIERIPQSVPDHLSIAVSRMFNTNRHFVTNVRFDSDRAEGMFTATIRPSGL